MSTPEGVENRANRNMPRRKALPLILLGTGVSLLAGCNSAPADYQAAPKPARLANPTEVPARSPATATIDTSPTQAPPAARVSPTPLVLSTWQLHEASVSWFETANTFYNAGYEELKKNPLC